MSTSSPTVSSLSQDPKALTTITHSIDVASETAGRLKVVLQLLCSEEEWAESVAIDQITQIITELHASREKAEKVHDELRREGGR